MANVASVHLSDLDIRRLEVKNTRYARAVGSPKELYIFVNPKGTKKFSLRLQKDGKSEYMELGEFRDGIYSVNEARRDALKKLKDLEKAGGNLEILKSGNSKYLFKTLFDILIKQKQVRGITPKYINKVQQMCEKYLLPSLANKDVKDITRDNLREILEPIHNPNNPSVSRLETIKRLVGFLNEIFDIAIQDGYLAFSPAYHLKKAFPSKVKFYAHNGIDGRYPALTKSEDLREFIKDLKNNNTYSLQTKRVLYLHILSANRPENTASVKWEYIDFEKRIWTIPAKEMKMPFAHEIPLTEKMLKILKEQAIYSKEISEFVFPSLETKYHHMCIANINKAIKNLGSKRKWHRKASAHGFRATFKTICSENEAELLQMGISEKVVESALAHNEFSTVVGSYERSKSTLETKRKLLQWYEDFLNSIEDLGV